MARKSIEDVMNEIEDFLNSCSTKALSSNKVIVPRDEFDELFSDLKVKIPAEIDRCKKIMRNKEAILMDARKTADGIIAEASAKAQQMVSQTEVVVQANQTAYETVEMARVQANEMLAQAVAEANEIRLGSMQYTNDIMLGIRNYVEATMEAERANYENLIQTLNNDYVIADANLLEIQNQIVEFTGNPNSVTKAPRMKTMKPIQAERRLDEETKAKRSMMDKVKQAVTGKEEREESKKSAGPGVNIPDFITSGETVVPNETPLEANLSVSNKAAGQEQMNTTVKPTVSETALETQNVTANSSGIGAALNDQKKTTAAVPHDQTYTLGVQAESSQENNSHSESNTVGSVQAEMKLQPASALEGTAGTTRKVKKKIVKKRNPVMHTPQTAQETVAKTLEAAAAAKTDKTVYKANGEQAREIPPMEGRVKRGPRVGRSMIDEMAEGSAVDAAATVEDAFEVTTEPMGKSMGVVDDFSMGDKI
ncbi:MAG: hypothetical protein K2L07_04485 [Lachnospiraceae bacterium]|nr:hypothetical protein [Lachnospiraceae bacterium]